MKQRPQKQEPSAAGRGGQLAAASRSSFPFALTNRAEAIPFALHPFSFSHSPLPIPLTHSIPCPLLCRGQFKSRVRWRIEMSDFKIENAFKKHPSAMRNCI